MNNMNYYSKYKSGMTNIFTYLEKNQEELGEFSLIIKK